MIPHDKMQSKNFKFMIQMVIYSFHLNDLNILNNCDRLKLKKKTVLSKQMI